MSRVTTLPEPVTDLAEEIMFSDPFPRYADLRRDSPVSTVQSKRLVRGSAYMLTRYDDVLKLHTDARFSSDILKQGRSGMVRFAPRMLRLLMDSMVFKDDPEHKRLRGLVNQAFTPKRVRSMTDDIERVVDELIENLERSGTVDLVGAFAVPLPLRVISAMLGVTDTDRDQFYTWTKEILDSAGEASPIAMLRAMPTARRMLKMFDRFAADRRVTPDDGLITALVRAQEGDDRLDDNEVVAMIFLLLLAGHDTTSNLIGNSILTLLEHPDQMERLRAEPALIDTAVEELLRFTSPVPCGAARFALEDIEVGHTTIPAGSTVLGMIISANRDESVFANADDLDLGRDPNRHIAFAFGSHYCLGNQLARIEGRAAIQALVQRFPRMRLAVPKDELRYKPTQSLRGLRSLPLHLG